MAAGKLFTIIATSIALTVGLSTLSAWGVASMVVTTATSSVAGVHGSAGTTGANGKNGATGTPGANGATGLTGLVGASGATGLLGRQGIAGAMGPAGPAGTSGASAPSFSFVSPGGVASEPGGLGTPFSIGSLVAKVPAGTALVGFSVALTADAPFTSTGFYCQLVDDVGGVLATSATLNVGSSSTTPVVFATTQVVNLPAATSLSLKCLIPEGYAFGVEYSAASIFAISFA
jgi:hypothetical protein